MKRIDFQRVWEESQMDIVLLQQEAARTRQQAERLELQAEKVRRIHSDTYEKVMGEPAPEFGSRLARTERAS